MTKSYLDMSDEELMGMSVASLPPVEEPQEEEDQEEPDTEQEEKESTDENQEEESTDPEKDTESDTTEADEEGEADETQDPEKDDNKSKKVVDDKTAEKEPVKGKDGEKSKTEVKSEPSQVDYKSEYEKLIAPFKANGRDMSVANIDEARSLMQMGANYNKKMGALKPSLKLLKILENNGLLSEEKIGYLIDLDKKNPEAISKLVKDSGIDPLDLSTEKASEYKPGNHKVDDRELELDDVLRDLEGTPTYERTLDVVTTKWDKQSKQVVAENPAILNVINDHIASGIYDLIDAQMQRKRVLGHLKGISDIQAYKQIGDEMEAKGAFNALGQEVKTAPAVQAITKPKSPKVDAEVLRKKKLAASSTKVASSSADLPDDYSLLGLSDEEFSKVNPKFM